MMIYDATLYRRSFVLAFALHLFLLLAFLLSPSGAPSGPMVAEQPAPIQAISVDQKQVMAQVAHIKAEQHAKKLHQQRLQKQAQAAKRARLAEQRRVARLRKQAHALQQQTQAAERRAKQRLAHLQQQQQQQQQDLQKLHHQQQQLTQKKTQASQQLAKMQAEAKALAAKRQAAAKAAAERRQWLQWRSTIAHYKVLITQAIGQQWIVPSGTDRILSCQFQITLAADGQVLAVSLLKSSGDAALDRSAQTAIYKASPLPMPQELKLVHLFKNLRLTVRPEEVKKVG